MLESLSSYRLNRFDTWNQRPIPIEKTDELEIKIAFWNVLTEFVTDTSEYLERFPQYSWKKRIKFIKELILEDSPTVLGLCELTFTQALDLKESFKKTGYKLVGFSCETKQSIEELEKGLFLDNRVYGEFVCLLFNTQRVQLKGLCYRALGAGEEDQRLCVEGLFRDLLFKRTFAVLASHFDHLSLLSRQNSGEIELKRLEDLEKQAIPWFSIGDRNWFKDKAGQECAEKYSQESFICDFRDDNIEGHYGPSGSFPGHLWLPEEFQPSIIETPGGLKKIDAITIDVGFTSRKLVKRINDYTRTGEFCPVSNRLLPNDQQRDVSQKNFASDHYYIGGTFTFN